MRRTAPLLCAVLLLSACGAKGPTPPGRHLVFLRALGTPKQALWIADVDGRRQRELVRGAGTGYVSPDGRFVAFERGLRRAVYLIGSDGSGERLLTRGVDLLDWTPDGEHVLALRGRALVSVAVDDGREVVYGRLTGRSLAPYCFSGADLYVVRLDGTHRRLLFGDGRSSWPVWGRGGIAFRRDVRGCTSGGLWRIRFDGSGLRPLLLDVPRRFTRFGYYGLVPYHWLDARRLVIGIHNEWGDNAALLERGRIRPLRMQLDAVSRDGRFLLGMQGGAEFPYTIAIGAIDGRKPREIARGRVCCPHWNR